MSSLIKKRILLIGNNSMVARSIYKALNASYTFITAGRSGIYDLHFDLSQDMQNSAESRDDICDIAINCVAAFKFKGDSLYSSIDTNGVGALRCCELAKKYGAKHFIQISTISALYNIQDSNYGYYSISKKMGETLVEHYCNSNNLKFTILRPTQLYDEYLECKVHQPLLFHMIEAAYKGKDFVINGSIPAERNFLFLEDFVDMIKSVIQDDIGGAYNCIGETNTLNYFAKVIYSVFNNGGYFYYDKTKPNIPSIKIPSSNLISQVLKRGAKTSFIEGMAKVYKRRMCNV